MNTERISAEIAEFEKKEFISLNDFMEQAKKKILHIRIFDACSDPIMNVYVRGSDLNDVQLRTVFAVSKGFDIKGCGTRYGQVLQRRLTFWFDTPRDDMMDGYGMDRDDFILYDAKSASCLFDKIMSEEEANAIQLPIMDVTDSIHYPNMSPASFLKRVPSTSYQLVDYLKTLSDEALVAYIRKVNIP